MTKQEIVGQLVRNILSGKLDRYLETIVHAANERRKAVRDAKVMENMVTLNEPGTKVQLCGTIRPKYLLGIEGTVVKCPPEFRFKPDLIYVDMQRTVGSGRRRYGPVVGVPANCLEAV